MYFKEKEPLFWHVDGFQIDPSIIHEKPEKIKRDSRGCKSAKAPREIFFRQTPFPLYPIFQICAILASF